MIINQPYDERLGIQLIKELENDKYTNLTIMVAYAKLSGVNRISPYLEKFREKGGIIRCVIGIDQQNTTYDALSHLLKLSHEVYIFHSESVSQTFHVKCYWLSNEDACWYAIGSNNLTAGGLFSNYELSDSTLLSNEKAKEANNTLADIYSSYTASESVCSHKLDEVFLEKLLNNGYVVKEIDQRKLLAEAAKQSRNAAPRNRLFGNEMFSVPAYSEQLNKNEPKKIENKSTNKHMETIRDDTTVVNKEENAYLIRLVPRAGNRSKQVHFTVDLLKKYFCLEPGDEILVQEMLPNGNIGEIEHRQVVFSQRNRNVKIELAGAAILDENYPTNVETRPILVLKRANANLFVYMILLNGNEGYEPINNRLKALPSGRSLPYEVIDESTMFSLWDNCPIV